MSTLNPRPVPTDAVSRGALVAQLDDADVLSIGALRRGGRAFVSGRTDSFTALVVEELPMEFRGYGDPDTLADLMRQVDRWRCLEVESELAPTVAQHLRMQVGGVVRFYGSVYYELHQPVRRLRERAVRTLHLDDLQLLSAAAPELRLDDPTSALHDGVVVGALVDGRLVARAACLARSRRHGDIGVATLEGYRGRGLATATASEVARQLQQAQLVPVWSTGEANSASQRIADKLGFTLTTRRTYVIPRSD